MTQVFASLRLAPEIQEYVITLPDTVGRPPNTERTLRPIAQIEDVKDQLATFQGLLP